MDKKSKKPTSFLYCVFDGIKSIFSEKEGTKRYRTVLDHFLNDGVISSEELEQLKLIEEKYGVEYKQVRKLQKKSITKYYEKIVSDKKISESEKRSIECLLNVFSLSKEDINFNQNLFNKYYTLGLIEDDLLPEISKDSHVINVNFAINEILHFGTVSLLRKFKKITNRINYRGPSTSIKICKGVRYKVGQIGIKTESKEILEVEDGGYFYITNQHIGFKGERKQFSFAHNKIISLELTDYGLVIFKRGKELPYILTMEDYEVPLSIISFILNKK